MPRLKMATFKDESYDDLTNGNQDVIERAAKSLKWSILYNAVPRVITPFSTMILAALLSPSDFGLVAIATLIVTLAQIVVDMGLGKAVIQRTTHVEESASVCLWLSLIASVGLYLALWFSAPWIASIYHNLQVTQVIRVAALFLPLAALSAIPKALLMREMEFRSLFWVNSSFLITQAIASVVLAFAGLGYWSIILGQLFGMAISVGLVWKLGRWRPQLFIDWHLFGSILKFSIWVMLSSFQNWMFLHADAAVASMFLGLSGLGVYTLGFNIATIIPAFFVAALGDVAYPAFCKLQGNNKNIGHKLVGLQGLVGAILLPMAFGISAIAPSVIQLLYGNKWEGLGTVIGFLVIMPGLSYLWTLNEKVYQAIGRPDIWTKLSGASLLLMIPLLWLAAPHGLIMFTIARFSGAWLLPLGSIFVGKRALGVGIKEQISPLWPSFLMALALFGIVYILTQYLSPFQGWVGLMKIFSVISIGATTYFLLLRQTNRPLWSRLIVGARQVLVAGNG